MLTKIIQSGCLLLLTLRFGQAQGTVPTFQAVIGKDSYTLVGADPSHGGTTTIPTVLVPITLVFDAKKAVDGMPFVMDANPDAQRVIHSPVFSNFAFPSGGTTQYADAMLRTTFPKADGWHTLLGKPEIRTVKIVVPVGYGYVLTSKQSGGSFAVADIEFLQKQLFQQLPKQSGKLVIAITHNTTYYVTGDATVCCSWGTHGVDSATGNSFVLGSYIHAAPAVVEDSDVQPLTQQLGEFVNDPLHDPLIDPQSQERGAKGPGNTFPRWMRPASMRPGDQGPLRRHRRRFHLFSARAHQHERQEQSPRIEGVCRQGGRNQFSPAKRSPAALVYRRI